MKSQREEKPCGASSVDVNNKLKASWVGEYGKIGHSGGSHSTPSTEISPLGHRRSVSMTEGSDKAHALLGIEEETDTLEGPPIRTKGRSAFPMTASLLRRSAGDSRKDDHAPSWKRNVSKNFLVPKKLITISALPRRISFKGHPYKRNTSLESLNEDIKDFEPSSAPFAPLDIMATAESTNARRSGAKSTRARRSGVDCNTLTMGLDPESANFLDFMIQTKCEDWLKSLGRWDPRACIKSFFDDVARDGADRIEEEGGFQPELLSPLLFRYFQRSSVFSVWRPTSVDSIRKMMTGHGTGKGLDIKGKSAKKGKLSAYVPFMQIHEDIHKTKIRALPRDGRIRIFYKKREARDKAHTILSEVMRDMLAATDAAFSSLVKSDREPKDHLAQDENTAVSRILLTLNSVSSLSGSPSKVDESLSILNAWEMDNPSIIVIDDYIPNCFGLDLPKRLFWEGYVMRAKDISREPGSIYDTGRPSLPSYQDMNFASIKNDCEKDVPRAVVWQYTDPYLSPNEPDPDPMMAQTLLMAYEENGRVKPVVSDFDCFLLGTRGVRFQNPLPDDQVGLVHEMIRGVETILKDCKEGKPNNWTASWLNVMKHSHSHVTMPKYGFGDPKSYAIMKHAVHRLENFGAVRHGAGKREKYP